MDQLGPIRVFSQDGEWLVDYGSYVHGTHALRADAIAVATETAKLERRELVIEAAT